MKSNNIIQIKSYNFALRIIKLHKHLILTHKEYDLSRQILRSGTSIGANIEEARESHYWVRLLRDTNYISQELSSSLLKDCDELLKIIGSIIKTTKENLKN
ncbi:MAG: four helix bundle protein [Balneola sp.]